MKRHVIRYTVKPEQAEHNEDLVRAVFAELDQVQPAGLGYATFKLADDVSFIHLVRNDTKNGHSPVAQLPALKAFHAGIRERCDEPPVRTELTEIGSFGLRRDD